MAPERHEKCTMHAATEKAIAELERRQTATDQTIEGIFEKLDLITNKLLGRPGWSVTAIITLLTTALGIAVTVALK